MAAGVTVKITGIDKAIKAMKKTDQKIARKVLSKALREGTKMVRDQAKQDIPEVSGRTRKSLKVRIAKSKKGYVRFRMITAFPKSADDAFYYAFTELGTKYIQRRNYIKRASDKVEKRVRAHIERAIKTAV